MKTISRRFWKNRSMKMVSTIVYIPTQELLNVHIQPEYLGFSKPYLEGYNVKAFTWPGSSDMWCLINVENVPYVIHKDRCVETKMPEPALSEIGVCSLCGAAIYAGIVDLQVHITPCPDCLGRCYDEGFEDGLDGIDSAG
jgi:hypothetical protein